MDSKSLYFKRMRLKSQIHNERRLVTSKGYLPLCPICDKPITGAFDMHEAVLTRGDVRGNELLLLAIMAPENVVTAHHDCHMKHGSKRWAYEKCVLQLLACMGEEKMLAWLEGLRADFRGRQIDDAIRSIKTIAAESVQSGGNDGPAQIDGGRAGTEHGVQSVEPERRVLARR